MKRLLSCACTLLPLLPALLQPVSANSAPTRWEGSPGSEVLAVEENCPISVTQEDLSFYIAESIHYSLNAQVSAVYQMENPTAEPHNIQMAFSLEESMHSFDPAIVHITADSATLPFQLVWDGVSPDYRPQTFDPDQVGTLYTFTLTQPPEETKSTITLSAPAGPLLVTFDGIHSYSGEEDGTCTLGTSQGATVWVYALDGTLDYTVEGDYTVDTEELPFAQHFRAYLESKYGDRFVGYLDSLTALKYRQLEEEWANTPVVMAEWLENYSDGRRCQNVANQVMDVLSGLEGSEVSPKLAAVIRDRDLFPKISQWIIGGDGWAYDIGYGGVDHVLSTGEDVNIVVLDTEMYSNTGGQKSKATPMSAVQQFAAGGKFTHKKEMGLMAMSYRNVYVASVALYADMAQAIRAFNEAESYNGPSIIFCYCPCLMQNVVPAMRATFKEVELAVKSGYWPLYRYDPRLSANGKNAFQLDYKKDLSDDLKNFLANERRFLELNRTRPQVAEELHAELKNHLQERHDDFVRRAMPIAKLAAASTIAGSGNGYELTILYGSETNHSKDLALALMQEAEARQVEVTVNELDEMSMEDLATKKHVVILCSTAGNGEFPKNAKVFFAEASKEHPSDLLKDVEIHVFGLGDSSFANYNAAAKKIHARLQALGAKSIDLALANDQDPERYMTAWENWLPAFWEQSGVPEPVYEGVPPSNFAVSMKDASTHVSRRRFLPGDAQLVPLVKKVRMTPADYDRNIMHLVFDLDKTDIRYKVGDALAIYPKNTDALVQRFCAYLAMDPETIVGIASSSDSLADKFPKTTTVGKIAAEILDLAGRPSRKLYKTMSYFAEGDEAAQLTALSRGEGELVQSFAAETASVMDVLEHFHCRVDLAHLLEVVPAIKPRLYSIASSQLHNPHLLELCIVVNTWKTRSGVEKTGLCTGYLDSLDLSKGPVQVAVSVNGGALFMPEDSSAPLLMAGLGTGIAPFRAFVQEKEVQKHSGKPIGEVVFMMGLRYRAKEFLFGEEFEALEKEGVISHLLPAFSRDQAQKVYIQHKVEENPALICEVLVEKKGFFFYCGPAGSVPTAIEKAIVKAFESVYKKSEEEAMDMLNCIKNEGRYVVEAWS